MRLALLMALLLPAPARANGIALDVSPQTAALRPMIAAHLSQTPGPAGLPMDARIDAFLVDNGPTLTLVTGTFDPAQPQAVEAFSAQLARVLPAAQEAVRTPAETALDAMSDFLLRAGDTRSTYDAFEAQTHWTLANALDRHRRHYLTSYQNERLSDYLNRLRTLKRKTPEARDMQEAVHRIARGLTALGLTPQGGEVGVQRAVYRRIEGFSDVPDSLLDVRPEVAVLGPSPAKQGLKRAPQTAVASPRAEPAPPAPAAAAKAPAAEAQPKIRGRRVDPDKARARMGYLQQALGRLAEAERNRESLDVKEDRLHSPEPVLDWEYVVTGFRQESFYPIFGRGDPKFRDGVLADIDYLLDAVELKPYERAALLQLREHLARPIRPAWIGWTVAAAGLALLAAAAFFLLR